MRELSWQDVEDILVGATVLGCGGGGDLEEGRELMRAAYEAGRAVTLAAPDELPAAALVMCPYGVGGLTVGDAAEFAGHPWAEEHPSVLAVRALGEHLGRPAAALITGELGGTSISDAFYPAALLGLPVVDADPVGRAVPELEHSLFYVHGAPIAPQAVVNEIGDTVIVTRVADDHRAEALVRALALASRNLVWVADHAMEWSRMREYVILGAISLAGRVGAAHREAHACGGDEPAAAVAAAAGAVRFRGRVESASREERDGFTWGEIHAAGEGDDAGASYRIWFKNENLMAWRDGVVDVTAPDLICCFSAASGQPVTNPHHEAGDRIVVAGVPAPKAWRDPEAVRTLGPAHFGFDEPYSALPGGNL
jgi:uncharacterized protein